MIKKFATLAVLLLFFVGVAKAETTIPSNYRVAVVDVKEVVAKSAQVHALKTEQEQEIKKLQDWLKTVNEDVQKQSTKEGKEKLLKKYNEDYAKKQADIKTKYENKLQAIDKSITKTIAEQAKAQNYNLIFAKGSVLFGGDDITSSIVKVVK